MWRAPDGAQRSRSFKSRAEAREWRATVERFEAAGQTPDPTRGDIRLEDWADPTLDLEQTTTLELEAT